MNDNKDTEMIIIDIKYLILAFIFGFLISKLLRIEHVLYISIIIVLIYIVMIYSLNNSKVYLDNNNNNSNNPNNSNNSNNPNNLKNKKKENFRSNYRHYWPSNTKKNNLPLNGLNINEYNEKFKKIYNETAVITVNNQFKEYNEEDCMISDKNSCNQKNPNVETTPSLLVECINNSKNLNQIRREDFTNHIIFYKKKQPMDILYRNAPFEVNDEPKDLSNELCVNCIV